GGNGRVSSVRTSGSELAPGDVDQYGWTTGALTVAGPLTLDPASRFAFEIRSTPKGGTTQDLVRVNGRVNLGGAVLNLAVGTPAGTTFTLIDQTVTSPVTGTFAGLPEGTVFSRGGRSFRISY